MEESVENRSGKQRMNNNHIYHVILYIILKKPLIKHKSKYEHVSIRKSLHDNRAIKVNDTHITEKGLGTLCVKSYCTSIFEKV